MTRQAGLTLALLHAAVSRVEKDAMDTLMVLGGESFLTAGEPALSTPLWGVINAGDTVVVSQLPEQLRNSDCRDHDHIYGVWSNRFRG